MTPLARLFDWLQDHPWRGFAGAVSFWVFGGVGIDVLDSLTPWNPGGQVTELIGGLLGLPLTAVAVAVLFQHLERAQLQPVLHRRRQAARAALSAVSPRIVMAYLGETVASSPAADESSTAPLLMDSGGANVAAERLDAISDLLLAVRLSRGSPRRLVAARGKPMKAVQAELVNCARLASMVRAQSGYESNFEASRDLGDTVVIDADVLTRTQVFDEMPSLPERVNLLLDDVRQLSTDPDEIATIDGLMSAMQIWSLHFPTRSSFPKAFDALYGQLQLLTWVIPEATSPEELDEEQIPPSDFDKWSEIEEHFRRAAQLLRVIYSVNGASSPRT